MSIDVKILKSSCCTIGEAIEQELKTASANAEVDINLESLSELKETMKYGVMNFPSIVVDGKAYSYDGIDDLRDLEQILKKHSTQ